MDPTVAARAAACTSVRARLGPCPTRARAQTAEGSRESSPAALMLRGSDRCRQHSSGRWSQRKVITLRRSGSRQMRD
eukprot:134860-Prymnesium_polylepis.1